MKVKEVKREIIERNEWQRQIGRMVEGSWFETILTIVLHLNEENLNTVIASACQVSQVWIIEKISTNFAAVYIQRIISFHFIAFHYISWHFITFHFISLHFIALHCIALHCISLQWSSRFGFVLVQFNLIRYSHCSKTRPLVYL
jgi:hypothetical protein